MRINPVVIFGLFVLQPALAAKEVCHYQFDSSSVKVNWTAFKTTEKVAVNGTVKEVAFKTSEKAKSLKALVEKTSGSGKFDSEKKSDSGNPARDATVFQKFFSLFAKQGEFSGSFAKLNGTDTEGKVDLKLSVNGKKTVVPMEYKVTAEGNFEATGSFDMMNLGMEKAHESIHTACEQLHKGKDGVSKTWTEIGLKIAAKLTKECK